MDIIRTIRKTALIGLLMIAFFMSSVLPVVANAGAAGVCDISGASQSTYCQDQGKASTSNNPIIGIIKTAINIVSYMAGVAAVVAILISSIKFMTANGDQNSISSAKKTLVFAAVGIIIVLIAQSIVAFALKKY